MSPKHKAPNISKSLQGSGLFIRSKLLKVRQSVGQKISLIVPFGSKVSAACRFTITSVLF